MDEQKTDRDGKDHPNKDLFCKGEPTPEFPSHSLSWTQPRMEALVKYIGSRDHLSLKEDECQRVFGRERKIIVRMVTTMKKPITDRTDTGILKFAGKWEEIVSSLAVSAFSSPPPVLSITSSMVSDLPLPLHLMEGVSKPVKLSGAQCAATKSRTFDLLDSYGLRDLPLAVAEAIQAAYIQGLYDSLDFKMERGDG